MRIFSSFVLILAGLLLVALLPRHAGAQTGSIGGFVTDRSDGRAMEGATVALYRASVAERDRLYGAATNAEGFYLISRLPFDRYLLEISFVGYSTYRDTIVIDTGQNRPISVQLAPDPGVIDEILVEAERVSGLANLRAGTKRIVPEELVRIPSPDLSADLAAYLTTLPTVVASGDRGGQLFIRGGEPQQNLTMLDGMVIYQPFHVLGFYSAFPADVLDRVDFSAGGWGAKHAGRLSSVLDARSRVGNNRRFEGMVNASPFTNAARLEGPILPGRVSFLVTGRTSVIDQAGEAIYNEDLPFRFSDAFAKLHGAVGSRHRFSVSGMSSYDRGGLFAGAVSRDIRWTNEAISFRWQAISKNLPLATELMYSRSFHRMEQDLPGDSTLLSSAVSSSRLSLHGVFSEGSMLGGRSVVEAGWDIEFGRTRNGEQALFLNQTSSGAPFPGFGFFLEPEIVYENGLRVTPGLRMHIYNVRLLPYLEPRFRASWEGGGHRLSAAAGIYYQQLLGLTDRRDPASVFTAWTAIPRSSSDVRARVRDGLLRGRIGKSTHFILGYQRELAGGLDLSIEAFYKRHGNLFVARWEAFPVATTALQQATGQSAGLDLRGEWQRGPLYASLSYGLSSTRYVADGPAIAFLFGEDRLHYRPPHDRRHNLNAVMSLDLRGFVAGLRWQFGSGFPYTKPLAFDGFALVDDVKPAFDLFNANRVVYDRPFGSILPTYHRLDASIEREWDSAWGSVAFQVSAINVYDRRNIFYLDVFTLERKDQLPFLPSVGLQVIFE